MKPGDVLECIQTDFPLEKKKLTLGALYTNWCLDPTYPDILVNVVANDGLLHSFYKGSFRAVAHLPRVRKVVYR